jgi:glycosyltransferase A (GT-A) superfamily protein (DUF2064 family)
MLSCFPFLMSSSLNTGLLCAQRAPPHRQLVMATGVAFPRAPAASPAAVTTGVVVLSKYPALGRSKSRLVPVYGAACSLEIALALLHDALTSLEAALREEPASVKLWLVGPADAAPQMDKVCLVCRWSVHPASALTDGRITSQLLVGTSFSPAVPLPDELFRGGDLGAILKHGLRLARERGVRCLAFVGTDCLDLRRSDFTAAWEASARGQAHIVPAMDGGYVLLGLPADCPEGGSAQPIRWVARA